MKSFRLWLLLLLAVLLPIRGALAAGMLCPVGGFGVQAEAQLAKHAHGHDAGGGGHEHHHGEISAQGDAANPDHGGGTEDPAGSADKCNLCSAFCSVTGIVPASVTVAAPQPDSAVFPSLDAPLPSFVADGQERPPRSI
ncbi:MAG: DUF2946 family protein [Ramlibacter sp.]